MNSGQIELLNSSTKKIYEFVLSAKEPSEHLCQALNHLIRHSLDSPDHFGFLLHRVNWFEPPFTYYRSHLLKIFRIYRSSGRQSCKVIYNLLIEGFFTPKSHRQSLQCFISIFSQSTDKNTILSALKENYPHKLCQLDIHLLYLTSLIQLCKTFKQYRPDFLQIIIENLTNFDTEVIAADQWVHRPFPVDQKIIEMRGDKSQNELSHKLDALLSELFLYLKELDSDPTILNEIFLVFQNKILPIKTTKSIQLIVFFVAQQSKTRANTFISFLLASIFNTNYQQNWYRIFTQSNFYLFSYLLRSKKMSTSIIAKTINCLIDRLLLKLSQIEEFQISQNVHLKEVLQARQFSLMILQSIVMIKLGSPQLKTEALSVGYEELLKICETKLHYDYFFSEEILERMQVQSKSKSNIRIKFSNKFLPTTLPLTASFIDDLMKIQEESRFSEDLIEYEKGPRKMHKGETPISYCSQTVI